MGVLNYQYWWKFLPNFRSTLVPGATACLVLEMDKQWTWENMKEEWKAAQKRLKNRDSDSPLLEQAYHIDLWSISIDARCWSLLTPIMSDGTTKPVTFLHEPYPLPRGKRSVRKETLTLIYRVWQFHKYLTRREFTLVTLHGLLLKILEPSVGVLTLATGGTRALPFRATFPLDA
jgi:hypothetical protein